MVRFLGSLKSLKMITKLAVLLAAITFLANCEEGDQTNIAAAQNCLNEMNSSQSDAELTAKATECRAFIAGINDADAKILECSSYFLEEGFFGQKVVDALEQLGKDANNNLGSITSIFTFKNLSNAENAAAACVATDLTSLAMFGEFAKIATSIGSTFAGGLSGVFNADGSVNTTNFENAIQNAVASGDTAALTNIGESVVSVGSVICSGSDASDFGDACDTLNSVNNGASSEDIGKCMAECLDPAKPATCATTGQSCNQ